MSINFATKEDIIDLKEYIKKALKPNKSINDKKWLRSAEVRKMLNISAGTLQNLRIRNTIPFTKIDTTYFYDLDKINDMLSKNSNVKSD